MERRGKRKAGFLQEHIIELKSGDPEQKQRKSLPEPRIHPIICRSRGPKLRRQDRGPDPPSALQAQDDEERATGAAAERNGLGIEKAAQNVPTGNGDDAGKEGAQSAGADAEP